MASDALLRRSTTPFWFVAAALFITAHMVFACRFVQAEIAPLVTEPTPLPFTYEFDESPLQEGYELQLKGENTSDSALILIIRIDNDSSYNYRTRFNREFSIPPGPYSLAIPMTGLKTSGKQPLQQPYSQMIIFAAGNIDTLNLLQASITPPPPRPKDVLALDFGRNDSPVFPRFEQVTIEDERLQGSFLSRFRPSGDALVQDGIEGVERFSMPWRNGQWKLNLWLQEQGEWEYLPHFLQRKVTAENQVLIDENMTENQWLKNKYLAGTQPEAVIDGDPWTLIGHRRTAPVSKIITIADKKLDIQFSGNRAARFIAALSLEPVNGSFADEVEKIRQERFLQQWPVEKRPLSRNNSLTFTDSSQQPAIRKKDYNLYPAAKGQLLNLSFTINSPEDDKNPVVAAPPPRNEKGGKLDIKTRYGHWRYERPQPDATSLIIDDSYLRSDLFNITLSSELPRTVHLQVEIPKEAESGIYEGNVQLFSKETLKIVGYAVEVLPVELPELSRSVGLYLEPAPFYQWFDDLKKRTPFATACDLAFLASMGFSTVAPSFATPTDEDSRQQLINQLKQLRLFGFKGDTLAYAPLKRLLVARSRDDVMQSLKALKQTLLNSSILQLPFWSIYDEPHFDKFPAIRDTANALHSQSLDMKTAGHLNNPKQHGLVSSTDLVIMNHGYGVSQETISNLQEGRQVWLYNMPKPRLAAGFYLWKSGADGYLQWHGRMPTADPFDPTDGREGDVVYIYPWLNGCPSTMNIHKRLLSLHEATLDLRWLQWLEENADTNSDAKALAEKFDQAIPEDWLEADDKLSDRQLVLMRKTLIEFARRTLKPKPEKADPLIEGAGND